VKPQIYLDTSVISAFFDADRPDRQALTSQFFDKATSQFELYLSEMTLMEIANTRDETLRTKMQNFTTPFMVLTDTPAVNRLAEDLIQHGAVPPNSVEDAYHIAMAIISGMDYLASWNFKHIVRVKTQNVVSEVTTLKGYHPIDITSPQELIKCSKNGDHDYDEPNVNPFPLCPPTIPHGNGNNGH
jgi:predicted nucleic acid-binding protein